MIFCGNRSQCMIDFVSVQTVSADDAPGHLEFKQRVLVEMQILSNGLGDDHLTAFSDATVFLR